MRNRMFFLSLCCLLLALCLTGCGASSAAQRIGEGTIAVGALETLDNAEDYSLNRAKLVANGNAFYKLTITCSKVKNYDDLAFFLVGQEEAVSCSAMTLQEGKSGVYDVYFSVAPDLEPLSFGIKEYEAGGFEYEAHLYDLAKKEWIKNEAYEGPELTGDFRFV